VTVRRRPAAGDDAIYQLNDAPFRGDAFMALEFAAGALDGADVSVDYPAAFGITPPPAPSPAG
jgi:hypothetical protein